MQPVDHVSASPTATSTGSTPQPSIVRDERATSAAPAGTTGPAVTSPHRLTAALRKGGIRLLESGASFALRWAVRLDASDTTKQRLARHARPEHRSRLLGTPTLVVAAKAGEAEVASTLLNKPDLRMAPHHLRDRHGWNALDHAAAGADRNTLRALLSHGEMLDVRGPHGLSSGERLGISRMSPDELGRLASDMGTLNRQKHAAAIDLLCERIAASDVAGVRQLLEEPGRIHHLTAWHSGTGFTPLQRAAIQHIDSQDPRTAEILSLVLNDKRTLDGPDARGKTLYEYLASAGLSGHPLAQRLAQMGVAQMIGLSWATRPKALQELLARPAYRLLVNRAGRDGEGLLHHVARRGRTDVLEMLLDKVPEMVDFPNAQGQTAVDLAALKARERGVDPKLPELVSRFSHPMMRQGSDATR